MAVLIRELSLDGKVIERVTAPVLKPSDEFPCRAELQSSHGQVFAEAYSSQSDDEVIDDVVKFRSKFPGDNEWIEWNGAVVDEWDNRNVRGEYNTAIRRMFYGGRKSTVIDARVVGKE